MSDERLRKITAAYRVVLDELLGDGADAPGVADSPRRAARAMLDLTAGYHDDLTGHLKVFDEPGADQLVLVGPIPYWSLCEHHLLPFDGIAVVGYIPQAGKIIGLSKIPRIVQHHARRLQNQERLGHGIVAELEAVPGLAPRGVGAILSSRHSCMAARGVRSTGAMITSALRGVMLTEAAVRGEFLQLAQTALAGG